MTKDRDFKKVVRGRAARTGESYSTARSRLRPGEPRRYSFGDLSLGARFGLSAAEAEARDVGSPLIQTDHLLVGVALAEGGGRALLARRGLARAIQRRVAELDAPPEAGEAGTSDAPVPSIQMAAALEQAFRAARDLNMRTVGTEHLLLGILAVPDSRGALVARALGIDIVGVKYSQQLRESIVAQVPVYSPELLDLLSRASSRARQAGAESVTVEDLVAALDGPELVRSTAPRPRPAR